MYCTCTAHVLHCTGLEEAYISYEVVTTTSLPQFSGGRFSVRRRFRDVVSLSNLLPKLLHGRCGVSQWHLRACSTRRVGLAKATAGVRVRVEGHSTKRRTVMLWPNHEHSHVLVPICSSTCTHTTPYASHSTMRLTHL
jgi:hypothetical protein